MIKSLNSYIDDPEIPFLQDFLFSLQKPDPPIILQNDILRAFQQYVDSSPNRPSMPSSMRFLKKVQEILHLGDRLILVYRYRKANCRIYTFTGSSPVLQQMTIKKFLSIKEREMCPDLKPHQQTMEINLEPFYDYGPNLKDPDTIGNGIIHLNRYMSGNLIRQSEKWNHTLYEFLKLHHLHGQQLLLDGKIIRNTKELEGALEDTVDFLERCDHPQDLDRLKKKLKDMGFLDGWGDTAERMLETINLLQDILEQPDGKIMEEFLARIPMISKVALISPHGWFGQKDVLGRPDTGGQVVYILDQARALERYLKKDIELAGLHIEPKILIITRLIPENDGTTSDQRLEKVDNANNVWILRVPFRDQAEEIVPHWMSRFKIWPYLDRFAIDVDIEIRAELQGLPDLIVGNYSDGNMVATLLSKKMGVIQCNIAHALEKSKYLFSDLFWKDFENEYNFSVQFMADLISMNLADFIITSTSQEITGTDSSIGQYESYQFFTMPGLMKVNSGINLFHPRFNVIPPGVNEDIFFSCRATEQRQADKTKWINKLLFELEDEESFGHLDNPEKIPIFSIARLDHIKNLTGFVEAFGQNEKLRKLANVIIIASVIDPNLSQDGEEAEEIKKMHNLIEKYELTSQIRWLGKFLSKEETGEVYRVIADRKGVFVQPALFEAFGLTILEAMHSGLPVFATQFGGPLEIIEDGKSGFLINPTDHDSMTEKIYEFIAKSLENPKHWEELSNRGLKRAQTNFTWELYCNRLTRLTKVYGFWRYSTSEFAKSRLTQYCHLLYHLFFITRARRIE